MRLFPLSALLVISGCDQMFAPPPPVLHEDAVVEQVTFAPGQDCSGSGVSTSGDVHFFNCSTEDTYAVVFRCKHGKFVVRHGDKAKQAWSTVKVGDHVSIAYRDYGTRFEFVSVAVLDGGVP